MHWFGGTMAEAVSLSKQRNAIFVVFVEGDNDLSKELSATIDESAVVSRLADQKNFLAVKLKSGSDNYTYFAQIYQFVPVPSLFFIGRNGTPLEVVCAGVEAQNLATRIDRILEEHRKEHKMPSVQPSTSSQNIKEETVNLLQAEANVPKPADIKDSPNTLTPEQTSPNIDEEPETSNGPAAKIQKTEHHEVTRSGAEYDVVCDGDVCVRRPRVPGAGPSRSTEPAPQLDNAMGSAANTANNASAANTASTTSIDDKVERAKELIEAKKREKAEKEKEEERQKELDRRSVGQGVAELKKWQADQELKQIQEERKREKMENNLARQRILEQIAQDRAERKARDQPQPSPQQSPQQQQQPNVSATWGDGAGRARLQLKLPDGGAHSAHFDATAPLGDVQRYLADNLQLSPSQFSLWTAFPRQELTDPTATLRQLQLAPSAALLVLPRRTVVAAHTPSPFASLITFFTQLFTSMILDPSYQVYSWLRARLFPRSSTDAPRDPRAPGSPSPPGPPRRGPEGPGVRRRGNVHRLGGDRATDDDNNTWNGNSTQQM